MLWEGGRSHPDLQPKQQEGLHGWVMKRSLLHFACTEPVLKVVLKDSHQQSSVAACKHAAYA